MVVVVVVVVVGDVVVLLVLDDRPRLWKYLFVNTIKSHKFLWTRGVISKYRKFELYGGRHKYI